jgi:hypothetical protein
MIDPLSMYLLDIFIADKLYEKMLEALGLEHKHCRCDSGNHIESQFVHVASPSHHPVAKDWTEDHVTQVLNADNSIVGKYC